MAINCFNLESAYATIRAAQSLNAPIIIDLLIEHMQTHLQREIVLPPIINLARQSSTNVCINLDHGKSLQYVKESIDQGFLSVMIDSSGLPFERNIKATKHVVEFSHTRGVSVEAEVGSLGVTNGNSFTKKNMYTDPIQAVQFIKATNVDALAVSFGSSHGLMPKGTVPKFNFDIVKEINSLINVPLVLHGGSGSGSKNIEKAVKAGINKINVGSDVMQAQAQSIYDQQSVNPNKDFVKIVDESMYAAKKVIEQYICLSGSKNKGSSGH